MDIANDLIGFLSNPAWNALSFFLGLWGGYHFALANDRRKERSTAAAPVVAFLLREREGPNPCLARPSIAELWGLMCACPSAAGPLVQPGSVTAMPASRPSSKTNLGRYVMAMPMRFPLRLVFAWGC